MYQQILVALDISPLNQDVFGEALTIARSSKAHLRLLHVLSGEEENSPIAIPMDLAEIYPAVGNDLTLENWRKQWEIFEQEGIEVLADFVTKAHQAGVKATYHQISATPGKGICRFAQEISADLIVMGRRGRTGVKEIILGSVSNYVLHHANCSVLIVQHS